MKSLVALLTIITCLAVSPPVAHTNPPVDCTTWKEVGTEQMVIDAYNNVVVKASDLWVARYTDPMGSKCLRFFFKSSNLTIWQTWRDNEGKSSAYLLLPDNTPFTVTGADAKWKIKALWRIDMMNLLTASRARIEIG